MKVVPTRIDDARWSAFVDAHPAAGPFHLPAWAAMIADCYDFSAFALTVQAGDGELLAGLPVIGLRSPRGRRRLVSLPFTDSCAPLLREGADADEVVAAIEAYVLRSPVDELEIRAPLPQGGDRHPEQAGFIHTMALPGDPGQLHPNKGHRNYRNQAVRKGVRVERGRTPQQMAKFYELHTLTRRRHGVPVQPRRFFDLLQERLIERGHGWVVTAADDDDVLSAAVYLEHNGTLVAKYQGSDPRLPDKRAGYLIDWEMMVAGSELGCHTLDLGRSDPDADGLRLYKSSWGADEAPLVYTHVARTAPGRGQSAPEGSMGLTAGASSRAADLAHEVIRRSPPWVCRVAGELLYRYAA